MISASFTLELLTPCYCHGAEASRQAEIRAPSIRGQLRWWFRVLGGFQSLGTLPLTRQETLVFGSANPSWRCASRLIVRVKSADPTRLISRDIRDAGALDAHPGSDRGYLLFPLRHQGTAVLTENPLRKFELTIIWCGDMKQWEDIQALVAVFGHLGALGFRSRRALGALAFSSESPPLMPALKRFARPDWLTIRQLPARDAGHAIATLAQWLRKWRSYGRTAGGQFNRFKPGFDFARKDHQAGLNQYPGPVYRPALGLPLLQVYSGNRRTVAWDESWNSRQRQGEGRFASPVILRPYRHPARLWSALVIFVHARRWPAGKKVWLNGQPREVSGDLYEAMQNDPALKAFPG